jgi:glycosyltransferase involved in cell wall biosynthesis
VIAAVPDAHFTLIGPAAEREAPAQLAEMCARHGIAGRVLLPGPRYGAEKIAAFLDADVLCLPSYQEAFPCTILEGMAAGLPVVATEVGGIPDMVRPGEHGFLIPAGDVPALVRALRQLAGDAALRREMGERNAAAARAQYTVATTVERIAAAYREVLA